jgi:hypothetical protein
VRSRPRDKRKRTAPGVLRLALAALVLGAFSTDAQVPPAQYSTKGYAASGVVNSGPVFLNGCLGYSKNGGTVYIQFFNKTSVPSDGVTPDMAPIAVGAASEFAWDAGAGGSRYFATGLSWAESTTIDTKTVAGTSDVFMTCQYNGSR